MTHLKHHPYEVTTRTPTKWNEPEVETIEVKIIWENWEGFYFRSFLFICLRIPPLITDLPRSLTAKREQSAEGGEGRSSRWKPDGKLIYVSFAYQTLIGGAGVGYIILDSAYNNGTRGPGRRERIFNTFPW